MKKFQETFALWVICYTVGYFLLTIFYCSPRLLAEFSTMDVSHIAENFSFPLDIFAWGLLAITSGYAGIDRGMLINKSMAMEAGQCDIGHPERLRLVIILLGLIWIENIYLNFYMSHDFSIIQERNGEYYEQIFRGVQLPLEGVTVALVSAIVIYVTCNEFIKSSKDIHKEK